MADQEAQLRETVAPAETDQLVTIKICYKQSRFELLCFLQLSHTHFSRAALEVSR